MATETVNPTNAAQLQSSLNRADMETQDAYQQIETLCLAVRDRSVAGDLPSVKRLTKMIEDRAFTAMNLVNSEAEKFGCNFKELSDD